MWNRAAAPDLAKDADWSASDATIFDARRLESRVLVIAFCMTPN